MKGYYTVTQIAKLLGVSPGRARRAIVLKLGVEVPRCGPSCMVPTEWLPAIQHELTTDARTLTGRKKVRRPRLRLD